MLLLVIAAGRTNSTSLVGDESITRTFFFMHSPLVLYVLSHFSGPTSLASSSLHLSPHFAFSPYHAFKLLVFVTYHGTSNQFLFVALVGEHCLSRTCGASCRKLHIISRVFLIVIQLFPCFPFISISFSLYHHVLFILQIHVTYLPFVYRSTLQHTFAICPTKSLASYIVPNCSICLILKPENVHN